MHSSSWGVGGEVSKNTLSESWDVKKSSCQNVWRPKYLLSEHWDVRVVGVRLFECQSACCQDDGLSHGIRCQRFGFWSSGCWILKCQKYCLSGF